MNALVLVGICVGAVMLYRVFTGGQITASTRVPCPMCQEAILPTALICPHCHTDLAHGAPGKALALARGQLLTAARAQRRTSTVCAAILIAIIGVTLYIMITVSPFSAR